MREVFDMTEQRAMDGFGLRERIAALGPCFHNIRLASVETAPDHLLGDYPIWKWPRFANAIPADLAE
jgi:tRNA (mo5U34)-methyltransferase